MNRGAVAEHKNQKVNLRVDMKILRTAAELKDTWMKSHTHKKKQNEKDVKGVCLA